MTDLLSWGTLNILEALMATVNIAGLILAVLTAAESHMDYEAVVIVGKNGARRLKAQGNRRDEIVKMLVHAVFLLVGVLVMASPAERVAREAYTVEAIESAVIAVSVALMFGSVRNLGDRRKLWAMPSERLTPKLGEHFNEIEAQIRQESDTMMAEREEKDAAAWVKHKAQEHQAEHEHFREPP